MPATKSNTLKLTAKQFVVELKALPKNAPGTNGRFFRDEGQSTKILNTRMASIFTLAKKFTQLSLDEVEKLLEDDYYEVRMGGVCIMDFQARDKKITALKQKELFDLYINRHDCINNWDMVDRAAPHVVGGYLFDKPRKILYKLAKSKNVWERRTAMVSTWFFIRQNELEDTFAIAEILINDKHDLINKAVGSWLREAGKRDIKMLLNFLEKYSANMPPVTLRYAIEKLDAKQKAAFSRKK